MILVTGGAGFIGGNFIHRLHKTNPEGTVVLIDNLSYAANYGYIRYLVESGFAIFHVIDIGNRENMSKIFEKYDVDYIINFAAESHVDNSITDFQPFIDTNITGTINLLRESIKLKNLKKFIHISTDEVYGSLELDDPRSFTETSPIETNSPYSASKAASDNFVRAYHKTYGLPAIITHCSNNYGPGQHDEKFIPTIIRSVLKNKKIPVYGDGLNIRDWLHVDDHCNAIQLILENGKIGEKYNIGGGVEIPNIDLVKKILSYMNSSEDMIEYVTDRLGHDRRYSIDCSKIQNELGYKPQHSFDEGLANTIEWYKKHYEFK